MPCLEALRVRIRGAQQDCGIVGVRLDDPVACVGQGIRELGLNQANDGLLDAGVVLAEHPVACPAGNHGGVQPVRASEAYDMGRQRIGDVARRRSPPGEAGLVQELGDQRREPRGRLWIGGHGFDDDAALMLCRGHLHAVAAVHEDVVGDLGKIGLVYEDQ